MRTRGIMIFFAAAALTPGLAAGFQPIRMDPKAYQLALDTAHRELTPEELQLVRRDRLASVTYLLEQMREFKARRAHGIHQLFPTGRGSGFLGAMNALLPYLPNGAVPPESLDSLYEMYGSYLHEAHIAVFGEQSPAVVERMAAEGYIVSRLHMGGGIEDLYELLRDEPKSIKDKVSFWLDDYIQGRTMGGTVLRIIELGSPAIEELVQRSRRVVIRPGAPLSRADAAVVGLTIDVLAALGDKRLLDFPLDDLEPYLRKGVVPNARKWIRVGLTPDLTQTRAYYLLWKSGDLFYASAHAGGIGMRPPKKPSSPRSPANPPRTDHQPGSVAPK